MEDTTLAYMSATTNLAGAPCTLAWLSEGAKAQALIKRTMTTQASLLAVGSRAQGLGFRGLGLLGFMGLG